MSRVSERRPFDLHKQTLVFLDFSGVSAPFTEDLLTWAIKTSPLKVPHSCFSPQRIIKLTAESLSHRPNLKKSAPDRW